MSKRLIVILALAFIVGISFAAYAEVQNIKVSGDLGVSALSRDQFDLSRGAKGDSVNDTESEFLSQMRLRVDADLTDNVSTTVRLINERNWDTETVANSDIDLDLAYVTLKEFLYSPLTVTVGRQELRFGNGMVIGNANATTNISAMTGGIPTDLSLRKAFDAIKANLNYDPLIIDVIYAKINETSGPSGSKDNYDTNLYGINGSYNIGGKYNSKADLYLVNKKNSDNSGSDPKNDDIYTLGALLTALPIENLYTAIEYAYQFGHATGAQHMKRAWAMELIANYGFPGVKYTPTIGASYAYLSGDKDSTDNKSRAWDAMYYDQAVTNIAAEILPFTDSSIFSLNGTARPMEDMKISLVWALYRLNESLPGGAMQSYKRDSAGSLYTYAMATNKKTLGQEVDLTATYDYTEDVQLGLTFGYFNPGKAFAESNQRDATQLIGSMKVTF
jgi:hypothetical protein